VAAFPTAADDVPVADVALAACALVDDVAAAGSAAVYFAADAPVALRRPVVPEDCRALRFHSPAPDWASDRDWALFPDPVSRPE